MNGNGFFYKENALNIGRSSVINTVEPAVVGHFVLSESFLLKVACSKAVRLHFFLYYRYLFAAVFMLCVYFSGDLLLL